MSNVIKYSDIYQKITRKLTKGYKLTEKEKEMYNQLCRWIAEDFRNESFTYNNQENCGN